MNRKNNFLLLIVIVLTIGFTASSCARRPKNVLNPNQMENLMVDLHVLEGSLQASGYSYGKEDKKTAYYQALFDKYNISKSDFDSCLSWYTKHPKQFERVYANVMIRIEDLQKDVTRGKFHPVDSTAASGTTELWNKATKFVFTNDSARNKLHFEIINDNLLYNDNYELSFLHRVAASDSSLNPHVVMYVNYLNGYIDSIYSKTKNDSTLRRYTLKFKARKELKIKSLSGYILGVDSVKGKMNAYVDSIKLTRKYNPFRQDSIRSAVNKVDTTAVPTDSIKPHAIDTLLPKELEAVPQRAKHELHKPAAEVH